MAAPSGRQRSTSIGSRFSPNDVAVPATCAQTLSLQVGHRPRDSGKHFPQQEQTENYNAKSDKPDFQGLTPLTRSGATTKLAAMPIEEVALGKPKPKPKPKPRILDRRDSKKLTIPPSFQKDTVVLRPTQSNASHRYSKPETYVTTREEQNVEQTQLEASVAESNGETDFIGQASQSSMLGRSNYELVPAITVDLVSTHAVPNTAKDGETANLKEEALCNEEEEKSSTLVGLPEPTKPQGSKNIFQTITNFVKITFNRQLANSQGSTQTSTQNIPATLQPASSGGPTNANVTTNVEARADKFSTAAIPIKTSSSDSEQKVNKTDDKSQRRREELRDELISKLKSAEEVQPKHMNKVNQSRSEGEPVNSYNTTTKVPQPSPTVEYGGKRFETRHQTEGLNDQHATQCHPTHVKMLKPKKDDPLVLRHEVAQEQQQKETELKKSSEQQELAVREEPHYQSNLEKTEKEQTESHKEVEAESVHQGPIPRARFGAVARLAARHKAAIEEVGKPKPHPSGAALDSKKLPMPSCSQKDTVVMRSRLNTRRNSRNDRPRFNIPIHTQTANLATITPKQIGEQTQLKTIVTESNSNFDEKASQCSTLERSNNKLVAMATADLVSTPQNTAKDGETTNPKEEVVVKKEDTKPLTLTSPEPTRPQRSNFQTVSDPQRKKITQDHQFNIQPSPLNSSQATSTQNISTMPQPVIVPLKTSCSGSELKLNEVDGKSQQGREELRAELSSKVKSSPIIAADKVEPKQMGKVDQSTVEESLEASVSVVEAEPVKSYNTLGELPQPSPSMGNNGEGFETKQQTERLIDQPAQCHVKEMIRSKSYATLASGHEASSLKDISERSNKSNAQLSSSIEDQKQKETKVTAHVCTPVPHKDDATVAMDALKLTLEESNKRLHYILMQEQQRNENEFKKSLEAVVQLKEEVQLHKDNADILRDEVTALKLSLEESKERLSSVVQEQQQRETEFKKTSEQQEQTIVQMQEEVQHHKDNAATLRDEVTALKLSLEESKERLSSVVQEQQQRETELKKTSEQQEQFIIQLQEELQLHKDDAATLRDKVTALKLSLEESKERLSSVVQEQQWRETELKKISEHQEQTIVQMQEEVQHHKQVEVDLRNAQQKNLQTIDQLSTMIKETNVRCELLEKSLQDRNFQCQQLEEQNKDLQSSLEGLQTRKNQFEQEVAAQKAQIEKVDKLDPYRLRFQDPLPASRKVGSGCYGTVYAVQIDGIQCIAKRVQDILVPNEEYDVEGLQRRGIEEKFRQECILLSTIRHPNIVQFMGVQYGRDMYDLTLVMECLPMDLQKCLEKCHAVKFFIPIPIKFSILVDVTYGLLHLHNRLILHRDLTAGNILLTSDLRAKIADLGVSRIVEARHSQDLSKLPGTFGYMPPEALQDKPEYNLKLDIFSFGVLALFIALQQFQNFSWQNVPDAIVAKGEAELFKRRQWISKIGEQHYLYPLIHQCLQDDSKARPSTVELNAMMKELSAKFPRKLQDISAVLTQLCKLGMITL